jgi:hypothetical protein
MEGYGSTVDAPTTDFYKEIHQAYLQAKIILTVRDSNEKWYESFQSTISAVIASDFFYFSIYLLRTSRLQRIMLGKMLKKWNRVWSNGTVNSRST